MQETEQSPPRHWAAIGIFIGGAAGVLVGVIILMVMTKLAPERTWREHMDFGNTAITTILLSIVIGAACGALAGRTLQRDLKEYGRL